MTRSRQNFFVHASGKVPASETDYEVVERKGIGHPDTLCDTIAEKISRAYSQYSLKKYGIILRHMVDKIALAGGAAVVKFGSGEMVQPVRLYLNCRFTRTYQGEEIPYLAIATEVAEKHFAEVMPLFDTEKWLTIVDNTHMAPGPGVVYAADGSTKNERRHFFEVPDKRFAGYHDNDMRSNDTSTAVAYAPMSDLERIAVLVETTLNSAAFKSDHPYVGTDIKVMACRTHEKIGITVCVPFLATHTPSKEFYFERLGGLKKLIKALVLGSFPYYDVTVDLNTRDSPARSDYYLTLTGSALESGDEGVVGRGNRYNGVIPFTRHMSMEASCGKNPVYHVGKVYTALAIEISQEIYEKLGLETYVLLTSQMGRSLSDPWSVCIEVCKPKIGTHQRKGIERIVENALSRIPSTTEKIIQGDIVLY